MSAAEFAWKVEKGGERLDSWLASRGDPGLSRSAWQRLISGGRVLVNGCSVTRNRKLRKGDEVRAALPPPDRSELQPEDIPLEVLFEDEDLLVLNKPPGLVAHPGAGHRSGTLVHALLHHCRGRLSGIGGVERPGIVHRLDADTSGCLVVAKNDAAHVALSSQFKGRSVQKVYLAIVAGQPRGDSGRIETFIGRHPVHRKKMTVLKSGSRGKPAVTEWRVRERYRGAALMECRLLTGRTHQIRVHCAHLGHPILGDRLYGKGAAGGVVAERQMLHALQLVFQHPRTGARVSFEAPMPADMAAALSLLRKNA